MAVDIHVIDMSAVAIAIIVYVYVINACILKIVTVAVWFPYSYY